MRKLNFHTDFLPLQTRNFAPKNVLIFCGSLDGGNSQDNLWLYGYGKENDENKIDSVVSTGNGLYRLCISI